jgi:hypothetical protein
VNDPKMITIARRGQAAIAALVLTHAEGGARLHAFSFTDESIKTAVPKALGMLGVPRDANIEVAVVVWDVPESMLDAHVVARFAAAVQANDTAYFYGLANSKGGQA